MFPVYGIFRRKNGFLEAVYQECLGKEFKLRGLDYKEKPRLQISYKGELLNQYYEPDARNVFGGAFQILSASEGRGMFSKG